MNRPSRVGPEEPALSARPVSNMLAAGLLLIGSMLPAYVAAESGAGLRLFGAATGELGFAPRLRTDVSVEVTGMLARIKVQQRFSNPYDDWVEGVYVFPLPEDAAVDRLRMVYAERLIEGEIRERERARRDYQQAKARGQAATLVDQQRANVFTTSVANIPPRETVQVEIEFQQQLQWRDTGFALRLPTTLGPRYIPGAPLRNESQGFGDRGWSIDTDQVPDASTITPPVLVDDSDTHNPLGIRVALDAGIELADIHSPSHAVDVDNDAPGHYVISLRGDVVPADRDFVLRWRPSLGQEPKAALFSEKWKDKHYGLLMLMPPHADVKAMPTARELILVVDTSGSMHGDSIAQARAALLDALDRLAPMDRFNIIQFNSHTSALFDTARPADRKHLSSARRYVNGLQADGGTEMLPAMRLALANGGSGDLLRQVVFITDGAVGNEQALFEMIVDGLGSSRLFTIGIGSAPNALFMTRAAAHGRGTFTYIADTREVARQAGELFEQLARPVLTDVRLRWASADGELAVQQAPRAVPDLYAGEPLVVAVQTASAAAEVIVEGSIAGRRWRHRVQLLGGAQGEGIHALWARRGIRDWMARRTAGEDSDKIREAVLDLALTHHLVSAYTSLIAVDQTPIRDEQSELRRGAVPSLLPAGWSAQAVFGRLPSTATPAPMFALLGLFGLILGWWSGRRRA